MSDVIIVEKMDQWIKITLNRPERLNALNVEMHLAFRAALEAGEASIGFCQRGVIHFRAWQIANRRCGG